MRNRKIGLSFAILLLYYFCPVSPVSGTCTDTGHRFEVGDSWVDSEVCDACTCLETGVQCYARLDDEKCKLINRGAVPYDPVCRYAMKTYLVGETFMAMDGCNKCTCTNKGMNCTTSSCNVNGFSQPSKTPLYGECLYAGHWYPFHSQWMSRDGCNTCFCYSIGNYRGGHVCTENKCATQIVNIAG